MNEDNIISCLANGSRGGSLISGTSAFLPSTYPKISPDAYASNGLSLNAPAPVLNLKYPIMPL